MDAERAQGLADLAVLLIGHFAGPLAVAEMAATIGVELAETAVVAYHRLQGGEGRGGTFLREEPGVQHAAVGVVERHHQVLHWQAGDPLMGRGIQMHQHADHRPPLAPAPILAARGFLLHHSGFLQHQTQPMVRDLHAVLLGDVFVKVPQREIGIDIALEPA